MGGCVRGGGGGRRQKEYIFYCDITCIMDLYFCLNFYPICLFVQLLSIIMLLKLLVTFFLYDFELTSFY